MSADENWLQAFIQEMKRRRVMRVTTLYVVLFWPVIQIVDILSPALELPTTTMRYLLIAFAVGFPIAFILSWAFDLNRSGMVRVTSESETAGYSPTGKALLGRTVERYVIGVLVVVIGVLAYMQYNTNTTNKPTTAQSTTPLDRLRAIAVLPFVTFSQNSNDQFFSDGLTEELLNVLSKLKNLRVIARTSSFAYKGVSKNVQEIGRELNVDTILEGSVRRNDIDDTIRITAQLINVETGAHVWSQTFDREYRDVFKIQDEIAAAVVDQLKITMQADEQEKIKSRASANPESMVAFSMGGAELAKRTQLSLTDATRYFQKAIEFDPQSAEAYTGLAKAHALLSSHVEDSDDQLQSAQQAVTTAFELEPDSADAWAAQGLIRMQNEEFAAASKAMQKAIALNPSHAMANMWYGNLQKDMSQKQKYHARAFELDPRSPVAGLNYANDLIQVGRETEAMEVFSKIVEADPYFPAAYKLVALINENRGRLDEAIGHYKRAYDLQQDGGIAASIASLYIDIGDFASADEWILAAEEHASAKYQAVIDWLKISALTAREELDAARQLMQPLLKVTSADASSYLSAVTAAYWLEKPKLAIDAWEKAEKFKKNHMNWMKGQYLDASIAVAYSYAQIGHDKESTDLLQRLEQWLDDPMTGQSGPKPYLWYTRAQIAAIRGEQNLALVHLQRAIDEGWRQHWRLKMEPSLAGLKELPNFQPLVAGLEARMDIMREQLAFDSAFAGT